VRHDCRDDVEDVVVTAVAPVRGDTLVQVMMSTQFDPAG
jgi:hypothetical protein